MMHRSLLRVNRICAHVNPTPSAALRCSLRPTAFHTSAVTASPAAGITSSATAVYPPIYESADAMYRHLLRITTSTSKPPVSVTVRNFCGTITRMASAEDITVETELFPREAMQFYTRHNLLLTDRNAPADKPLYEKYYTAARGGGQGDYRYLIREKLSNVVDSLKKFPNSKRAVLTVPFPTRTATFPVDPTGRDDKAGESPLPLHHHTDESKCLRELHFYLDEKPGASAAAQAKHDARVLCCTGFMRAQAVSIFPKNIHFIGSIMQLVGKELGREVGSYTHFVTTMVAER